MDNEKDKENRILSLVVFMTLIGYIFLASLALMLLWNVIMPIVFGLTKLTFWHALGILMISRILFGNCDFTSK